MAGEVNVSYPIDYPQPTWAEQSAEMWFGAFVEAMRALIAQQSLQPGQIRAIGLASQVDGVVAMDASGAPLYPAIIWMDRRAVEQCAQVAQNTSQAWLFDLSGLNLDPSHVAPKIQLAARSPAGGLSRAQYFLLPGSYLAYKLTGELGVDYSNASSTLLMDVRRKNWSPELCESVRDRPGAPGAGSPRHAHARRLAQRDRRRDWFSCLARRSCWAAEMSTPPAWGRVSSCRVWSAISLVQPSRCAPPAQIRSSTPPGCLKPTVTPTRTCG